MTPARIAEIAGIAWPAGHETTSIRAIERAIRLAVNEVLEEVADSCELCGACSHDTHATGYFSSAGIARSLKLPEDA